MTATLALTGRMLRERRRLLLWMCVGSALMVLAVTALYPSLGSQYGDLMDSLPEALLNLFGGGDLGTPAGYLETELLSFVAPGLVLGVAIAFGAGALAGSEQSGHLALVYTAPISRTRVALAALIATTVATVTVTAVIWLTLLPGNEIGELRISISHLTAASVMLGLLGIATGAIAFGVGAATGSRGLAAGLTSAVAVASYLIYALAPLSETTNPLRYVSIWYPFSAGHPLLDGISAAHAAVLVALAAVCAAGGIAALERRDVQG